MSNNITGTPRAILNGVQDRSGGSTPLALSQVTGFHPILYLLTQRGPEGTHDLASVGGISAYGAESFRAGSAYFNHQTVLANETIPYAPAHIHRVRLPNAARAVIRVSAELATCTLPIYLYDTLGNVVTERNEAGVTVPVIDGYTVGSRIILHYGTDMYPAENQGVGKGIIIDNFRPGNTLAQAELSNLPTSYLSYTLDFSSADLGSRAAVPTPLSGMTTNDIMAMFDEPTSPVDLENIRFHSTTLIPLFDTEVAYFGGVGNQLGLVIDDLTTSNSATGVMWDINNFVYQLRLIEKLSSGSTRIINTSDDDRVTTFSLGSNAYSDRTHTDYNAKSVIARKYSDNLTNGYTYDSNINNLQKMLVDGYELTDGTRVDGELSFGNDGLLSLGIINLLGGLNANGKPYKTLRLQDSYNFGGSSLGGAYPAYGQQGSDGLVYDDNGRPDHLANLRLFDEEVRRQLDNFGDLDDPLLDIARYPISTLVDTGFSQETKDAMIAAYNKRPDIFAILATFRVADYTEPEAIPDPDPRASVMVPTRPGSAAFAEYPNAIKAQYLTYSVVKDSSGLVTDVNIVIDQNIPTAELYDDNNNMRNVLLGLGLINTDWNYLNLLDVPDPESMAIGTTTVIGELNSSQSVIDHTLANIRSDYALVAGNLHIDVLELALSKSASVVQSSGLQRVGAYKIDQRLNYDGIVAPSRKIYKETESLINVHITYTHLFTGDENVVVFTANSEQDNFSGSVGDVTFSNLNGVALVNFLALHGIEAQFVPFGSNDV